MIFSSDKYHNLRVGRLVFARNGITGPGYLETKTPADTAAIKESLFFRSGQIVVIEKDEGVQPEPPNLNEKKKSPGRPKKEAPNVDPSILTSRG